MTAFRRKVAALSGVPEERIARLAGGDLSEVLRLEHGIPSHDTFGRVFAALDPAGEGAPV